MSHTESLCNTTGAWGEKFLVEWMVGVVEVVMRCLQNNSTATQSKAALAPSKVTQAHKQGGPGPKQGCPGPQWGGPGPKLKRSWPKLRRSKTENEANLAQS